MFPGILRKASLKAKPSFFKKNFFGAKPQIKDPDLAGPQRSNSQIVKSKIPTCREGLLIPEAPDTKAIPLIGAVLVRIANGVI